MDWNATLSPALMTEELVKKIPEGHANLQQISEQKTLFNSAVENKRIDSHHSQRALHFQFPQQQLFDGRIIQFLPAGCVSPVATINFDHSIGNGSQ